MLLNKDAYQEKPYSVTRSTALNCLRWLKRIIASRRYRNWFKNYVNVSLRRDMGLRAFIFGRLYFLFQIIAWNFSFSLLQVWLQSYISFQSWHFIKFNNVGRKSGTFLLYFFICVLLFYLTSVHTICTPSLRCVATLHLPAQKLRWYCIVWCRIKVTFVLTWKMRWSAVTCGRK